MSRVILRVAHLSWRMVPARAQFPRHGARARNRFDSSKNPQLGDAERSVHRAHQVGMPVPGIRSEANNIHLVKLIRHQGVNTVFRRSLIHFATDA